MDLLFKAVATSQPRSAATRHERALEHAASLGVTSVQK